MTPPSWSAVADEVYCIVAAQRIVRGSPVLPKTDPAVIAAAQDPEVQRRAAVIKHKVAQMPALSAEQIEKLRGLLPYPYPAADSTAA
jgi:hypothetical protein